MSWSTFVQELESFFSSVGQAFLTNIKAAYPVLEQAALNFLSTVVDAIIAGIESGAIPLPVLVAEPGDGVNPDALGNQKRAVALAQVRAYLVTNPPPAGMTITTSLINSAIEISVAKMKQVGNGGNFPGGNSGPVAA